MVLWVTRGEKGRYKYSCTNITLIYECTHVVNEHSYLYYITFTCITMYIKNVPKIPIFLQASLTDLMEKMLGAEPQFVRCVKPNNISRHGHFEGPIVQRQLKYTGVLETIKIRRQGFPSRLPIADFLQRYNMFVFCFLFFFFFVFFVFVFVFFFCYENCSL